MFIVRVPVVVRVMVNDRPRTLWQFPVTLTLLHRISLGPSKRTMRVIQLPAASFRLRKAQTVHSFNQSHCQQ